MNSSKLSFCAIVYSFFYLLISSFLFVAVFMYEYFLFSVDCKIIVLIILTMQDVESVKCHRVGMLFQRVQERAY